MPLEPTLSPQNYVKVQKIFVSSEDRNQNSKGPYQYEIDLTDQIQYVIGCEVTGYNFPSDIAPTFIQAGPGQTGTNLLDFEIIGPVNTIFTATWPEKQYAYENVTVPYLSYVNVLQQIMNQAIASDPNYGTGAPNEATFTTIVDPEEITNVTVSGVGVTGFRFLFLTGPNNANSSYNAMGWNKIDTAIALNQQSPGRTLLRPFRFFDITIQEFEEFQPLKRIYATNNIYYGSVRNDPNVSRTRLLSSDPVRILKKLRITITLEGGIIPPIFAGREHEMTLTVFSVANEVGVPMYVRQLFVL